MARTPKKADAPKTGRPSDFSQETADRICELIVESDYGLEQICAANDDLPNVRTVFRWLAAHDTFRQQYARAKEAQGHVQGDRAVKEAVLATDAALGRLKFDARKWSASKLAPKLYGDRVSLDHSGEVAVLTSDERKARIAELAAKSGLVGNADGG